MEVLLHLCHGFLRSLHVCTFTLCGTVCLGQTPMDGKLSGEETSIKYNDVNFMGINALDICLVVLFSLFIYFIFCGDCL